MIVLIKDSIIDRPVGENPAMTNTACKYSPENKNKHNTLERYKIMSKAIARKPATLATILLKDKRVEKSSHGKFKTVASLERHRVEKTAENLRLKKGKKKKEED